MRKDMDVASAVHSALDQAVENGYDQSTNNPESVARDLFDNDADIAQLIDIDKIDEQLTPHVRSWQQLKAGVA
jgi:hypothetical protein